VAVEGESEWAQYEPTEVKNAPHSFVINRGKVGKVIKELMGDIRKIMEPYTASQLKVGRFQTSDFLGPVM
jgi:ribosome biogenesis protein SSF1/2